MTEQAKDNHKLHAVVAPKQKKVNIMVGNKVMKTYTFKMDIPCKKVTRAVFVHDYNERCVADRDSVEFREETVWDKETMDSIGQQALDIYKTNHL